MHTPAQGATLKARSHSTPRPSRCSARCVWLVRAPPRHSPPPLRPPFPLQAFYAYFTIAASAPMVWYQFLRLVLYGAASRHATREATRDGGDDDEGVVRGVLIVGRAR
eukprot:4340066-Pleurochrysis_carterae.AAC.1